jgi:twinkle protein
MKIISLTTSQVYDFEARNQGENHSACPECSKNRKIKNQKLKCFSFTVPENVGYCNHCNAKFIEYKSNTAKKEYKVPEHKNNTQLSERALKWFEGRMISQKTLIAMGVYSDMEFMPQTSKEESVICFPYLKNGKTVNIKYRTGNKDFKLVKDAELVFYNIDALYSESLSGGSIIITEGEIDALSFMEAGIPNVISVPNGAGATSLEYMDSVFDEFEKIKTVYIAVDNDIAGIKLKDELLRRIGAEKCLIVSFKDCKDANEYISRHGGVELTETIKNATEPPIHDIVKLTNIYDDLLSLYHEGLKGGLTLNMPDTDRVVSWETGRIAVVTGIPGHGKSEFIDFLISKLNIIHNWKVAYYSPENFPVQLHYAKIASKISGKSFGSQFINRVEFDILFQYIEKNYFFICPEEDNTIENILMKAKYLVRKHGIKIVVIDPYNKLEHLRKSGETETEYISRLLDKLSIFSKQNNCLVILIAHPTKMKKDATGKYEVPNLYDINGSANFYNKCDYGISIYRDFQKEEVNVYFIKIKFKHLGEGGIVGYIYNKINGRYEEQTSHLGTFEYNSYLNRDETKEIDFQPNIDFEADPF